MFYRFSLAVGSLYIYLYIPNFLESDHNNWFYSYANYHNVILDTLYADEQQ